MVTLFVLLRPRKEEIDLNTFIPEDILTYLRSKKPKNYDNCDFLKLKTVCLDGNFYFIHRGNLESAIRKNGGEIKSTMSKKVDLLIIGKDHDEYSTKMKKYKELIESGVTITKLTEEELLERLGV